MREQFEDELVEIDPADFVKENLQNSLIQMENEQTINESLNITPDVLRATEQPHDAGIILTLLTNEEPIRSSTALRSREINLYLARDRLKKIFFWLKQEKITYDNIIDSIADEQKVFLQIARSNVENPGGDIVHNIINPQRRGTIKVVSAEEKEEDEGEQQTLFSMLLGSKKKRR